MGSIFSLIFAFWIALGSVQLPSAWAAPRHSQGGSSASSDVIDLNSWLQSLDALDKIPLPAIEDSLASEQYAEGFKFAILIRKWSILSHLMAFYSFGGSPSEERLAQAARIKWTVELEFRKALRAIHRRQRLDVWTQQSAVIISDLEKLIHAPLRSSEMDRLLTERKRIKESLARNREQLAAAQRAIGPNDGVGLYVREAIWAAIPGPRPSLAEFERNAKALVEELHALVQVLEQREQLQDEQIRYENERLLFERRGAVENLRWKLSMVDWFKREVGALDPANSLEDFFAGLELGLESGALPKTIEEQRLWLRDTRKKLGLSCGDLLT